MAQMPRYERNVMRGKEMLEPNPNERSSEGRQGKLKMDSQLFEKTKYEPQRTSFQNAIVPTGEEQRVTEEQESGNVNEILQHQKETLFSLQTISVSRSEAG